VSAIASETTGAGPPLVLIHGVGTNRSIWSLSLPALAETRSVTALDLPGFGESDPPERGWELDDVARSIGDALAARIETPFDLIGSSLGGAVALSLAVERPELVRRLILCAPAGFRPAPGPIPLIASNVVGPVMTLRRLAGLQLAESATARRALLSGTVADGSALSPDAARVMLQASAGARSLTAAFSAAAAADLRELAAELERPLGLVWGSLDRLIPAHTAEKVLEIHPDTPLEVIAGVGHIPHLERPDLFVPAVERLFEQMEIP